MVFGDETFEGISHAPGNFEIWLENGCRDGSDDVGCSTANVRGTSKDGQEIHCTEKPDGDYKAPRVKSRKNPKTPMEIINEQGRFETELTYCVGTNGKTNSVGVVKGSGLDAWDKAASDAVAKWRFYPAELEGDSIEVCGCDTILYIELQS